MLRVVTNSNCKLKTYGVDTMDAYGVDLQTLSAGLLLVRVVIGLVMAAHGAQKLFGWFGGYGLNKTGEFFVHLGFQQGRTFAAAASRHRDRERATRRPRLPRPDRSGADDFCHDRRDDHRSLAARTVRHQQRCRGAAALRDDGAGARAHRLRALLSRRAVGNRRAMDTGGHMDRVGGGSCRRVWRMSQSVIAQRPRSGCKLRI